jgi:predicted nucleotidyltransferase
MTVQELQLPPTVRNALQDLKQGLQQLYGERLRSLYLYGSYARGEATEDSDVDVLIMLKGEVNPYRDIDRCSAIVSEICLKYDLLITTLAVSEKRVSESRLPLYINIRREAALL